MAIVGLLVGVACSAKSTLHSERNDAGTTDTNVPDASDDAAPDSGIDAPTPDAGPDSGRGQSATRPSGPCSKGPVIAKVIPGVWMFTNGLIPASG